ncbi:MAG: hypothetical protein ABSC19_15720 [Syntrophorhabdales bacterium]|jgi:hypothetical protein
MLTKAHPRKVKVTRDLAAKRFDKTFNGLLTKLEEVATKRILETRDPLRTGLTIAREIRKVADTIDADVIARCIDETEAGIVREEST